MKITTNFHIEELVHPKYIEVYVTADATNLTVTYGGGGTSTFAWQAKL